jgi:N-acetylglucosamine-6-sulfatase
MRATLESPAAPMRDWFLAEHYVEKLLPRVPDWQAVRSERWKYIRYPDLRGMDEFYDLASDPCETRNLIFDGAMAEPLQQARKELDRLLTETTDTFPV